MQSHFTICSHFAGSAFAAFQPLFVRLEPRLLFNCASRKSDIQRPGMRHGSCENLTMAGDLYYSVGIVEASSDQTYRWKMYRKKAPLLLLQ